MKYILLSIILLACETKNQRANGLHQDIDSTPRASAEKHPAKNEILGIWADGSGPNASFRIDEDSIYDVEHFTMSKYTYENGMIEFHVDGEIFPDKVFKPHRDTLAFEDEFKKIKYWRFTSRVQCRVGTFRSG